MKKYLGLLLALALVLTPVAQGFALAESDVYSAPLEATSAPALSAGESGLQVELEEGTILESETEAPAEGPVITLNPTQAPAFNSGYARVAVDLATVAVDSAGTEALATLKRDACVLAVARSGECLWVVVNTERGILNGCVDAKALQPLTDAEIRALQDALAAMGEEYLRPYNDDLDRLIPWASDAQVVYPGEEPSESAEPAETAAPETTEAPVEATEVTLSATALTIGVKEAYSGLSARVLPETCTAPVTWRSSNKKVARVDTASGVITGVKKGTAVIYAETANGVSASCKVTVKKAPAKVSVSPASLTMSAGGMRVTLKPAVNSGAACGTFTYTSDNEAVASVSSDGTVTAISAGTATITVRSYNKKKASCKVTVYAEPASAAFTVETLLLAEAQTGTLSAEAKDAEGAATRTTFTYVVDPESEDPDCIELNAETGAVKALKKGSARITAMTHNGIATGNSCLVKVVEAPADIRLSADSLSLGVKETSTGLSYRLVPREGAEDCAAVVTWRSSNAKVAKVNAVTGAVTGVKKGNAYITAETHNGLTARCRVSVGKAPTKVTLKPASITLSEAGQTVLLKPVVNTGAASGFTYRSSNEAVATVSTDGVVTSGSAGTAVITASTFNKKKATCKITVVEAPAQVLLPESLTICERQTASVTATAIGASGAETAGRFTYTAENGTGSISVDAETGAVTGLAVGTAFVRVSTHNGVTTHLVEGAPVETVCAVTVVEGPEAVELSAISATLGIGEYLKLTTRVLDKSGAEMAGGGLVKLTRSGSAINLGTDGTVKAIKTGPATVTAETVNGLKANCAVTVKKAPTKVTLSPAKPELGVEQSGQILVTFPKGQGGSYTFESSNHAVATIDEAGWVTAHAIGTSVISVKTYNNKTAKVTLTVSKGPDYITLNADSRLAYDAQLGGYVTRYEKQLGVGETFQLKAAVEYASKGSVSGYESDNPAVATVSEGGLITALQPGSAAITVRSSGGAEAVCRVTVSGAGTVAASLAFDQTSVKLKTGRDVEAPVLKGLGVTADQLKDAAYRVENAEVAAVRRDASGRWVLYGIAAGTTKLTASVNGLTATLDVQVVSADAAPEAITFARDSAVMALGESWKPAVRDAIGDVVAAWLESSDASIISVSEDNVLTAEGLGTTTVRATLNSLTTSMTVSVQTAATSLTLAQTAVTLGVGERFALNPQAQNGGAAAYEYASSASGVATVSADGIVTAWSAGSAEITVTGFGGISATCKVTVGAAPTRVTLSPDTVEAETAGGGVQLTYGFGSASEAGSVRFASSDPAVATVSASGYVTFISQGSATITVETYNGLMAAARVTVGKAEAKPASSVTYRLFTACGYARPGYNGKDSLPFPKNNATSVAKVFGNSRIDGVDYVENSTLVNPSKSAIFTGMASLFAGADDDDVSVVYLCSHGHMMGNNTGYRMSLPGYTNSASDPQYYMSSAEIFNALRTIRGKVVLILDSCYSGIFIEDMRGNLYAEGGRISVLTAAFNTRATFYNVKDTSRAVDFFTFFLLQGLGYDERNGYYIRDAGGAKGSAPGLLLADTANREGKKDGVITVAELYAYASACIAANIPSYSQNSWFWGSPEQQTRCFEGGNGNLAIYRAK